MGIKTTEEEYRLAKIEKIKRYKDERFKYYIPTGVGKEFIDRVGSGKYFVSLFSAANGIGKTGVGANILANFFWPRENDWFSGDLFLNWPFPKRARIITDPTTITSTIIPELRKWFPYGRYKTDKRGKNYEYYWTTDTGWEFEIMSYDQDIKEFESATIGLCWMDEPPPESIYKASVARLRLGGLIYITATPLTGSAWIYDQVISNPNRESGRRTYIEADVESACVEHGERGFLRHEDIENMIAEYSEDEKQARVYGKFQHLVGLIYKQWDRKIHVIRPFNVSKQEFAVYEAIDPHRRTNDAVLWLAVDRHGQKFVVDELFVKCQGGVSELSARIKDKADRFRIERRIADPWIFEEDSHTGKSLNSRFVEHGIRYLPATKKRVAADRRLGEALDFQMAGSELIRTPELYVFDTCARTIYEIEHWRWDEWQGKQIDKHGKKEKPVDKDDHMIENLGRLLIQEPKFIEIPLIEDNGEREDDFYAPLSGDPYQN